MSVSGFTKPSKKVYEVEYECLSTTEIEKNMEKEASNLSSMFGVDVSNILLPLTRPPLELTYPR